MSEEFITIFLKKRSQIGWYLIKNCEYNHLLTIIINIEIHHNTARGKQLTGEILTEEDKYYLDNVPGILSLVFNTGCMREKGRISFYQLPTLELFKCIWKICEKFNIKQLYEVAAGSGLLSFVSNKIISKNKHGLIIIPSDSKAWYNKIPTYQLVKNCSFSEFDQKNCPILISWLHPSVQKEFIDMVQKNEPKFIIHVGEGHGGSCYNTDFISILENLQYICYYINIPMLSAGDFGDYFQKNGKSTYRYDHTIITFFVKKNVLGLNFPKAGQRK